MSEMKISLGNNDRMAIQQYYDDVLEEVKQDTHALFDELVKIYTAEKYLPLMQEVQQLGSYYSQEFQLEQCDVFERWEQDKGSICASVMQLEAAKDADNGDAVLAAKELEAGMKESLCGIFQSWPNTPTVPTVPEMSQHLGKTFEDMQDLISQYINKVEALETRVKGYLEQQKEDNLLYGNVAAVLPPLVHGHVALAQRLQERLKEVEGALEEKGRQVEAMQQETQAELNKVADESGKDLSDSAFLFRFR